MPADNTMVFFSKRNISLSLANGVLSGDTTFVVSAMEMDRSAVDRYGRAPDMGNQPVAVYIDADPLFTLTPNPANNESVTITVDPMLAASLADGVYNYVFTSDTGDASANVTLSKTTSTAPSPTNPSGPVSPTGATEPKLKYFLEYDNVWGDVFRLEIYQKGFTGDATEIAGYANLDYQDRKDLLESVVASSMKIYLEANLDITLADLYTENEQDFTAQFYRNGQKIFHGFIKPDGIWESYTEDQWIIDLDAIDGLSILKNLSFVKPDGTFFTGKISQKDAIKACLSRIGYDLPLNTDVRIAYDGYTGSDILSDVLMNTERFYQDTSNKEIMDCEAVLKSILEPYNAVIIQQNGEWWVYRPVDLDKPTATVGSHINGYSLFHCNANQRKTMAASVQAYRIKYQYGNVKTLAKNEYLDGGLNAEGWKVYNINNSVYSDGSGIYISNGSVIYPNATSGRLLELNQDVPVGKGNTVTINIGGTFALSDHQTNTHLIAYVSTDNYWLIGGSWVKKSSATEAASMNVEVDTAQGDLQFSLTTPPFPEDSKMYFHFDVDHVFSARKDGAYVNNYFAISSVSILPAATNIKGKHYTAQRLNRVSSVTKDDKTVYVGDSSSNLFVGTLYKADGTPTTLWHRDGVQEAKELLEIAVTDVLRTSPRPMTVFEGDVCGYFPAMCRISIEGFDSVYFQPLKWSYDTKAGVIKALFREYSTAQLADYRFEVDDDYGNETKVTIK